MKKTIIVGLLLLCCKLLLAQSPMYMIEVYVDGAPVMDFSKINQADIKWKMTNVTGGGVFVNEADGEDWYFNPYGMDGASLPTFTLNLGGLHAKKPLLGGETMVFEVEVTGGIYAGYKGKLTFIQSAVFINDLTGATGINLTGAPELKINVDDVVLCTGVAGSVTATVTGVEGPYTVTWSPEITASGADGTTGNIPASLTEGTYRATVTTAAGTAFKDFTVRVLPVPDKPGITLEAQQNAGERQLSFKVSNEPAEHGFAYSWFVNNREVQPGGERFVAENLRDGDVVVCKTVGGGECASGVVSDEFVVDHRQVARQAGEEYFVPNLITPNGDGLNDTWRLDWLQSYPKHLVTVYSSRGKMVYQSDHYQNDWDGRVNGKTTYGVFTYKIDLPGGVVLQSWVEVRPAHR